MPDRRTIRLSAGNALAEIALVGAEPVRWCVGGREILWSGDPAHWSYSAPILFPLVGASAGGVIRVDRLEYPMPQHGFARTSTFELIESGAASARFRLSDSAETWERYPFAFQFEVTVTLTDTSLIQDFAITNSGDREMPYALGIHPAFPWPLGHCGKEGHRVVFEAPERPDVPEVAPGGLLARIARPIPLAGNVLPLSPDLFSEALVFLDARSRAFAFEAPDGRAIEMRTEGFPHLAVWSRPTAPFLSLEAWTGHADWEDASGELADRASMIRLAPGESRGHRITMTYRRS